MHTNKLEEKKHDVQPKNKQKSADLSDTGIISDQNNANSQNGQLESINGEQHEDSFQRLYSKELDLDEDEVPIILHELNDSAIHFISRDQYERALSLLQKAQTLIDRLQFQRNPNDRFIVLLTMHNMALCFQKLGALEECAICLEASLQSINSPFLLPKFQGDPSKKLKKLKYECKAHMQVCALLSQLHRHKEALIHAEKSVMIAQYMINDLLDMCQFYQSKILTAKKNEQIAQELMMIDDANQQQNKDLIYYDDSISMLERTAYRIFPIIQEVQSRMIKTTNNNISDRKKTLEINELLKQKLNMKAILGYLNQSEWLYLLNIGNIMQITPLTVHDLYSNQTHEVELTRDAILEKISFLAVSYFCMSTELRFLVQVKDDQSIDPIRKKKESEFWHAKALEISCSFLPSESPLVSHILTSYQKHHAPVQQEIPEDEEQEIELKVIRPLPGIDICKFQPMVRQDEALNISIPQLPLSPNNYSDKRRQSIDPKASQIVSLPFSPNNQGTTANASQNNLFSSQIGHKNQTTDSSSSNLVPSQRQTNSTNNGNSTCINPSMQPQQQFQSFNRFNKNKISGQGVKKNNNIMNENNIGTSQQDIFEIKSKFLNDISNIQNSSDILEELEDEEVQNNNQQLQNNSNLFDVGHVNIQSDNEDEIALNISQNNQNHNESQEVEIVMEQMNKRRNKQQIFKSGSRSNSAQRRILKEKVNNKQLKNLQNNNNSRIINNKSQFSNQVLDMSQDYFDDDSSDSDQDILDDDQFIDDSLVGHSKSKQQLRMQNNLSMDGARMRRPQTSQGIRKNFKQINHNIMAMNTQSNTSMTLNNQKYQGQNQGLQQTNQANGIISSGDQVSPNNAIQQISNNALVNRQVHNQSANITNGKVNKHETLAIGFHNQNNINGSQTDFEANSTPVKQEGNGRIKSASKYNRENMNLSRANLDQRTNQSSNSDQINQNSLQRPGSKQKRMRNKQDQNTSLIENNNANLINGNQKMPQLNNQTNSSNNIRLQGILSQNQMQNQQSNSQIAHTQLNSHNHSQMILNSNNNNNKQQQNMIKNISNNTSQGFYNNQNSQQYQQRSNSQTKKHQQRLNYSGGKQKSGKQHNIINTSITDNLNISIQQQQLQQMQLIQQQKYITSNQDQQTTLQKQSLQQNQKTLQDLFMIDRLVKKRANQNNTHEQTNKSFEVMIPQNNDPKYNSQHLHNSNSRSKSRSKLTTTRSKDKHQSQQQQNKSKSNGFNTHANITTVGSQSALNSSTIIFGNQNNNNNSSILLEGSQNNNGNIQQQNQNNIEELKRQILLKQALIESNKNSRRKSTGNLNTSGSLINNNQNSLQITQQKKRIDNVNQSMRVQGSGVQQQNINSLQSTQQNSSQQWLQAQVNGQKQNGIGNVNTHQVIKKFLKDRQNLSQQQLQQVTNFNIQNQQISSLNNSMLDNYPINSNNLQQSSLQQSNLFASDLSTYKMQLSKKIMQQQQKLLGASQQDTHSINMNVSNNNLKKQGGHKKGQYITESHPKQQQRSATPIFEMYENINGQSRTQKQITQSNSLGMYMNNINIQQKKDKSLNDIGNFNLQQQNQNNSSLATYLKDYQSVQDLQNQSLREDSFIKSMKKQQKNSKKTTPKNILASNNQFMQQ